MDWPVKLSDVADYGLILLQSALRVPAQQRQLTTAVASMQFKQLAGSPIQPWCTA